MVFWSEIFRRLILKIVLLLSKLRSRPATKDLQLF
jgi:hypothetical protein